MAYATSKLSAEEKAKVPTAGYVPLTWDELVMAVSLPVGERPRVYGYVEGEPWGAIVKLSSAYYVEQYEGRLSFAWLSGTTLADLVGRA